MSNEAQGLVRNLAMDAPHKPILMAYANYADEAGYCWPGTETIAFDTGYSVPTVVRVRRELIKGNWIRSKRRFGTSAGTRLNLPKMAAEGVDRGDRTKLRPEFEFEDESAGQTQRDQADLNANAAESRTDQCDRNEEITLISTRDHTDHLSLREPSGDPSVGEPNLSEGGSEPAPAEWAVTLIADLEYGRHRRPSRKQAVELARRVEAAHAEHGLSEREIKRHCQATLNEATKSGVPYLRGGLEPARLPVPTASRRPHSPSTSSGNERPQTADPSLRAALRTGWKDLSVNGTN